MNPLIPRTSRRRNLLSPWMDEFFEDTGFPEFQTSLSKNFKFNPSCDVKENSKEYVLKFDLPGVKKEDIRIDLEDNRLTVSGERREEKKEEGEKEYLSETYSGSYSRSFTLPGVVKAEKADASYRDGVLTLRIPKSDQAKSREIPVH